MCLFRSGPKNSHTASKKHHQTGGHEAKNLYGLKRSWQNASMGSKPSLYKGSLVWEAVKILDVLLIFT